MKLSEKLIQLRKEKGLSQEEFGNQINVSRQAVSKWENDEATPDVKKIKEIVQKFNVDYEYLLNDERETKEKVEPEEKLKTKSRKSRKKMILKVILIIFSIYLFICVYKFITFYRFYTIADSFSEENYMISLDIQYDDPIFENRSIVTNKVNNKKIQYIYEFENKEAPRNEEGNIMPYEIEYTDFEKRICYKLTYDTNKKMYIYHDRKEDMINEEEIEELLKDDNLIKRNTLENIPSSFQEILLASVDPRYYDVSLWDRSYKMALIADDATMKVRLNHDYLIELTNLKLEYDHKNIVTNYSYDYVQDHFKEIEDPIESGKYKYELENR